MHALDRRLVNLHRPQELPPQPQACPPVGGAGDGPSLRAGNHLFALPLQSRKLADHGVSAYADLVADFAAAEACVKGGFQQIESFLCPGWLWVEHVLFSELDPCRIAREHLRKER